MTEFSGFTLREVKALGKTDDALNAHLTETLKLEEPKLTLFRSALEMIAGKEDRVKRVLVYPKPAEGEKAPAGLVEKSDHLFGMEFFPAPPQAAAGKGRFAKGPRDGKRGDKRGPRGDGRNERRRSGEGRSAEDRPKSFGDPQGAPGSAEKPARPRREFGDRKPRGEFKGERRPRQPEGNRPERAPRGPRGATELRLVLKGQPMSTLPGSVSAPSEQNAPTVTE